MKRWKNNTRTVALAALLGASVPLASAFAQKLLPKEDYIYHNAFPDLPSYGSGFEYRTLVQDFESLAAKKIAWSMIGSDWSEGIYFPAEQAQAIVDAGSVPFIVMLPWSIAERWTGSDPYITLDQILNGAFDVELIRWARDVKSFRKPVLVSFAPEANGSWFPWSGLHSGGETAFRYGDPLLADGPERFRDAYRYIIDLFRAERVGNVTWFLQLVNSSKPLEAWNEMAAYYPGDDYIDWLGVSVYSAQELGDDWIDFSETMDVAYEELDAITEFKPLAILEWGTIEDQTIPYRKADWITDAFASLTDGRYPRVKAVTYWHESPWQVHGLNNMRIDSSPYALRAYRQEVANDIFTSDTLFSTPVEQPTAELCKCGVFANRFGQGCSVKRPDSQIAEGKNPFLASSGSTSICATEQQCLANFGEYLTDTSYWCPNGWVLIEN